MIDYIFYRQKEPYTYSQNIASQKPTFAEPLKGSKIKTASSDVGDGNMISNKSSTSRRHKLINQIRKVASSDGNRLSFLISYIMKYDDSKLIRNCSRKLNINSFNIEINICYKVFWFKYLIFIFAYFNLIQTYQFTHS